MTLPAVPSYLAITGRVKSWLESPSKRLPVSCTVFVVEDSMEGKDGIEDSWTFASKALRNAAGVAIHLSKLRPRGVANADGLVASGPVSFAKIYSMLNEILRRGGVFKNGAITLHLDYDHPDAVEFIRASRAELPWVKRTLNVDQDFLHWEYLDDAIEACRSGDLWLAKKRYDRKGERIYHNVCIAGDTVVMTSSGPTLAKDLVGKAFKTAVNGVWHSSSERGMWSNGYRQVVTLSTKEGYTLKATPDHKILTPDGWKMLQDLEINSKVMLQNHTNLAEWKGKGNFDEGWLLGWLLGDGTYAGEEIVRMDFYGSKSVLFDNAMAKLDVLEVERCGQPSTHRKGSSNAVKSCFHSKSLAKIAVEYGVTKAHKKATELLETTSSDFHKGFLQAYFDADGTVNLGNLKKGSGKCVSVTSVNYDTLQMLQRMLLRFGIRSRIWKERYNGGDTILPDGTGNSKAYACQKTSRLDISGQICLRLFRDLIGFSLPEKQEKLETALAAYNSNRAEYYKPFWATVSSVVNSGIEEVFDCTIPSVSEFDGNGFHVHNCLEISLPSRGTCLLSHVNLGKCPATDLPEAFEDGMHFLCELHAQTGTDDSGIYLSSAEDKQVGLGVLGLANRLAIDGITYLDFVNTLERYLHNYTNNDYLEVDYESPAYTLVHNLFLGFQRAATVAKSYGMVRAFTVAPTATCSYRYTDSEGYTTTPEIAPPIDRQIDRDSDTFGVMSYDYNPKVEIASEVGWDVFFRLNCAWQELMNVTGLAHSMSTNWWSDMTVMDKDFVNKWLESPLLSLYYSLQVMPSTQDKSTVWIDNDFSILGLDEKNTACGISEDEESFCSACAE